MITAALIGGQSPQLVQIIISATPDGEPWTLTGHAGDYTWDVPGGTGVGDGEQLSLTDNLAPGNREIVYTLVSTSGEESSDPLTVPFATDLVLQSLNGQFSLAVDLLQGSLEFEHPTNMATFRVPRRARPVVRYDVLGDVVSAFNIRVDVADTPALRTILKSGEPVVYRCGAEIVDLDPVGVIAITSVTSPRVYTAHGHRIWNLGYELVDHPNLDRRLGAFSWDFVDGVLEERDWDEFDTLMSGLSWNEFDVLDWTTY